MSTATLMNETQDLADLPPGSRLVVRIDVNCAADDSDLERVAGKIRHAWEEGTRVFVLAPGMDLFVVTPDGKVTGTGAAPPAKYDLQEVSFLTANEIRSRIGTGESK